MFVTVTDLAPDVWPTATLPQDSEEGEKLKDCVVGVTASPAKLEVCGLPVALSFTDKVALFVPLLCGANVTEMVQLVLAATDVPQVLVSVKSVVETPMLEIVNAVDWLLVRVKLYGALLLPTATVEKV